MTEERLDHHFRVQTVKWVHILINQMDELLAHHLPKAAGLCSWQAAGYVEQYYIVATSRRHLTDTNIPFSISMAGGGQHSKYTFDRACLRLTDVPTSMRHRSELAAIGAACCYYLAVRCMERNRLVMTTGECAISKRASILINY